jgi:predicted MFS family arabinose efflux permease
MAQRSRSESAQMDEHTDRTPPAWLRPLIAALGAGSAWGNRQRVLLVLVLILSLDYGDRTLIGALGPTLERTFHSGPADLGILAAAFSFVSAGATIPLGILADRVNRTRLLGISVIIWVAAIVATGASVTFTMLLSSRLLLGSSPPLPAPHPPRW